MLSPETIPNHVLFESADGTSVLIYGPPSPNQADHTQVRFWSTDIERDVRDLLARGVVFEDYDFPTLKTVDHVATTAGIGKSAWFKLTTRAWQPLIRAPGSRRLTDHRSAWRSRCRA